VRGKQHGRTQKLQSCVFVHVLCVVMACVSPACVCVCVCCVGVCVCLCVLCWGVRVSVCVVLGCACVCVSPCVQARARVVWQRDGPSILHTEDRSVAQPVLQLWLNCCTVLIVQLAAMALGSKFVRTGDASTCKLSSHPLECARCLCTSTSSARLASWYTCYLCSDPSSAMPAPARAPTPAPTRALRSSHNSYGAGVGDGDGVGDGAGVSDGGGAGVGDGDGAEHGQGGLHRRTQRVCKHSTLAQPLCDSPCTQATHATPSVQQPARQHIYMTFCALCSCCLRAAPIRWHARCALWRTAHSSVPQTMPTGCMWWVLLQRALHALRNLRAACCWGECHKEGAPKLPHA